MTQVPAVGELLAGAPRTWGRWGDGDEVGSLNYLTAEEVLRRVLYVATPLEVVNGTGAPVNPVAIK